MVNWGGFSERSAVAVLVIPTFGQFWFRQLGEA